MTNPDEYDDDDADSAVERIMAIIHKSRFAGTSVSRMESMDYFGGIASQCQSMCDAMESEDENTG